MRDHFYRLFHVPAWIGRGREQNVAKPDTYLFRYKKEVGRRTENNLQFSSEKKLTGP